ncbi:MAG: transketolase [Bacteroidota bacterium]
MVFSKIQDITKLNDISYEVRKDILCMLAEAESGHTGGSLGLADVFTCLYFSVMDHDTENPLWIDRDRLILSIGHVAPVLYATLANVGYFPKAELLTLRNIGSRLQGHPSREQGLPGIELSSGSLGQGLSVAVGIALAAKMDSRNYFIYCIMGDGEIQEGSVWEAAMSAAHYRLENLIGIIDRNKLQIDGKTSNVMEVEPLKDKWKSFGWSVIECDGNNHVEILSSFEQCKKLNNKPHIIIANTLMGKGVREIENNNLWHGKAPTKSQAAQFISMLE